MASTTPSDAVPSEPSDGPPAVPPAEDVTSSGEGSSAETSSDDAPSAAAPAALSRARRIGGPVVTPPRPAPGPKRVVRAEPATEVAAWGPEESETVPPEPAAPSRAGRDLPMAIGVGLGLGAVVLLSLFVYRPSFAVLVGLAVLYGTWELAKALATAGIRITLTPIMVGGVALLAAAYERGSSGLVVAVLVTLLGVLVWRIGDGALGYTRDVTASTFCLLYLPMLAGFAVLLADPSDGAARVVAFVATVVCSDTGGFASGVLFGKHPLAPVVSKAKTWEGFAGSLAACITAGVLFLTLTFHEAWWTGVVFGVAVTITATLGDLGESMIKRDLGVKDMGQLLPGHGGLMDRLDSLLPCAAVSYLLLSVFAPV